MNNHFLKQVPVPSRRRRSFSPNEKELMRLNPEFRRDVEAFERWREEGEELAMSGKLNRDKFLNLEIFNSLDVDTKKVFLDMIYSLYEEGPVSQEEVYQLRKDPQGRMLPGIYPDTLIIRLRKAVDRENKGSMSAFFIPAIKGMSTSDRKADFLNPGYLPNEYWRDTLDKEGNVAIEARIKLAARGNSPSDHDEDLQKLGILRKFTTVHLANLPRNGRANRYLFHIYKRLWNCLQVNKKGTRKNPEGFWFIVWNLIRYSLSLKCVALCNVEPHWFKNMSKKQAMELLTSVGELARIDATEFIVREVEIPKPDGGTRTLSVPPLNWRLYLYIINLILSFFLDDFVSDKQHGHRKGKGVGSAWKDILDEMVHFRYIWEFDFADFHPSIPYDLIRESLIFFGVSPVWVERIMRLNSPSVLKPSGEIIALSRGVPQGVSTSAILGIAVLERLGVYRMKDIEYVGYADDGILGSNRISDLKGALEVAIAGSGISLKERKCKYLKIDGNWVAPLKFVGCELSRNKIFKAATRAGNSDEMVVKGLSVNFARKNSSHLNLLIGRIFGSKSTPPDLSMPGSRLGSVGQSSRITSNSFNWSSFSIGRIFNNRSK
jgi:Reverse transcriptase (RNA-dependent DNA polymerase)